MSDDLFEYQYEGGVHTARATANQSDINHDVEVRHRIILPGERVFMAGTRVWEGGRGGRAMTASRASLLQNSGG